MSELTDKLEAFLQEAEVMNGVYYGKIERDNNTLEAFAADEELQEAVRKWIERKKYAKLGEFSGEGLAGELVQALQPGQDSNGHTPRRVSLPTYPFAKERYWVP